MHDGKVIMSCVQDRGAYDKVEAHVDVSEFTPMAAYWWDLVRTWYTKDSDAPRIDQSALRDRGERHAPAAHKETLMGWFDKLEPVESPTNVVHDLLEVKRFAKGNELSAAIQNQADVKAVRAALEEYSRVLDAEELDDSSALQYAATGDQLFDTIGSSAKWLLSPEALNESTDGGVLPGDFIIVFGRKESAKTLFCVNLTCHWLRQGGRILYIGNEDRIDKIKWRVLSNLSNMDKVQITKWQDTALDRARKKGFDDRLVMVHLHPGTIKEVEELVIEHKPDILIVDQIRNIGGGGDGLTSRMNQVAIDFRQLISKYSLVGVGVTQAHAGEHGKPKVWLENDDIADSRIGLPAQGDLIIGIGFDSAMAHNNTRAISLPTNKISGVHEGFICRIDPTRSKVST